MPRRRKKWKRRHKPKFVKFYTYTQQDYCKAEHVRFLEWVYGQIAKEIFGKIKNYHFGEWVIKTEGIVLFIDPELGMQAEIQGTSKMPLLKRLTIHIRLLELLKKGYCILKAVKLCLLTLATQ